MRRTSSYKRLVLAAAFAGCAGSTAQQTPPGPPLAEPPPAVTAVAEAAAPAVAAAQEAASQPAELVFPENEAHRAKQPEGGEMRAMKTPTLQRFKLPQGIDVFLVERHNLPIVNLYIVFEGGGATDPKDKIGQASVCSALMSDGTEKLEKLAFEEALADVASNVSANSSNDQHFVSMDTLTKNLDTTLDLWADTLLRPGMRQGEFDRSLKRRLAGLQQMKGTPAAVAGRLGNSVVYGPDHLFGRFPTEGSYGALKLDDCKKWVADYVKPQGAQIFVVGDIDKATLTQKLGARLTGWKGRAKTAARPGRPQPRKGRIFFVDIPNAPQSVVQLMHAGPVRKAPDYHATSVMSSILGGGFSSRINMNVREKNGYAYGAGGGFAYTRVGSAFRAQGSVKTDVTKEAILEILNEIRGLYTGEPTDAEMVREKQARILALPAQFATGGQTLGAFRDLIYYGLPLDYYDTFVPKVQAIEKAAVKKAAAKHLKPGQLQLLVVGDGKTVLPKLKEVPAAAKELANAEIVMLDVDGKPVGGDAAPAKQPGGAKPAPPAAGAAGASTGGGSGGGATARP